MPWFKVDDRLHSHPKWMACSMAARGLWGTAGSWCAGNSHDGIVTQHALRLLGGSTRQAAELVDAGLWEPHEDGWLFHDWPHYQPTTEQVEAERTAARERQRRAREKGASRRDTPVSHTPVTPRVTVPPTRPDPSTGSGTRGSSPLAPAPHQAGAPLRAVTLPGSGRVADYIPPDPIPDDEREAGLAIARTIRRFSQTPPDGDDAA